MNHCCGRIIVLFIVLTTFIPNGHSETCTLNYKKDFPDNETILLRDSNQLLEPTNDAIQLDAGKVLLLACPGDSNTVNKIGKTTVQATCVKGQTFKVENNKYSFSDLNCIKQVTSDVDPTSNTCGTGNSKGVIKNVGFKVNGKFLNTFYVCNNINTCETIYADHVIYGSAIAYGKPKNKDRPSSFKDDCKNPKVRANSVYQQAQQLKTFESLLGSQDLAKQYIKKNSYLAKGHLAANADFVFVTSARSTFFYSNTVPQWQQINIGNWLNLEKSIRSLAAEVKNNIRVITGGWKVLQLEDNNRNMKDIYLSGNLLPVPKFIWKIAYSPTTKKGIAFININNPFLTKPTKDEILCTNICSKYSWGKPDWEKISKGYLYCCDIRQIKNVIDTIPALDVSDILKGPAKVNLP